MPDWHALIHKYRHFLRYTLYGFVASLVNILVYFVFTHVWHIPYVIGNNVAWVISNAVFSPHQIAGVPQPLRRLAGGERRAGVVLRLPLTVPGGG